MEKENIFNIPNLLSFYRIVAFPVMVYLIFSGNVRLFSILLCTNLVTDVLDGFIARTFHLQTRFGARLDSLADIGTYILAVSGIFAFKWQDIGPSKVIFFSFLSTYLFAYIVSFARFGKFPSLHLYSCKIGGYIQGIFFFVLFFYGYVSWLFTAAMIWGMASYIEETLVLLSLRELKSDCKGLYWVMKSQRAANVPK